MPIGSGLCHSNDRPCIGGPCFGALLVRVSAGHENPDFHQSRVHQSRVCPFPTVEPLPLVCDTYFDPTTVYVFPGHHFPDGVEVGEVVSQSRGFLCDHVGRPAPLNDETAPYEA